MVVAIVHEGFSAFKEELTDDDWKGVNRDLVTTDSELNCGLKFKGNKPNAKQSASDI